MIDAVGRGSGVEREGVLAVEAPPPDLECLWCGYLMGPSRSWACPECGRVSGPAEVESHRRRGAYLARGGRRGRAGAWSGAIVLILLVLAFAAGMDVRSVMIVGAVLAVFVLATSTLGRSLALLWERRDRTVVALAWRRSLWRLHAPWLVIPGCALMLGFGWATDRLAGWRQNAGEFIAVLGLPLWAIGSVSAYVSWWGVVSREFRELRVRNYGWRYSAMVLVALVVVVAAMALGLFLGGSVAAGMLG